MESDVEYSGMERNRDFAERILTKHQRGTQKYLGIPLIYHRKKTVADKTEIYNRLNRFLSTELNYRISQYEKKYYQNITNQDNRRFIQTIEEINNQPGEKKQMILQLRKLGVLTQSNKEWQDTKQTIKRYEEELIMLNRRIKLQEEMVLQMKSRETPEISAKSITDTVMENIKREIRLERMRYGPD